MYASVLLLFYSTKLPATYTHYIHVAYIKSTLKGLDMWNISICAAWECCSTNLCGVQPNQQIHAVEDWAWCQFLLSMHPGCHQIQSPCWRCWNKSVTSVISDESESSESIPSLAASTHARRDKKRSVWWSGSDRPDYWMLNCIKI